MQKRQSLLIEFNELSPVLIDRFAAAGELPNFSKFKAESTQLTTLSRETGQRLEPWVEWVTVHTGQPLDAHRSYKLGDNEQLSTKTVGQILSDHGVPVGIYSSMNLRHSNVLGYCIPDPWDKNGRTVPSDFQLFYDIVSSMVQESSRTQSTSAKQYVDLLRFLASHGLSIRTAARAAMQLMAERFKPSLSWRRAMILDQLNYDISRYLNRKYQPAFATFFSNSTAHFQHYFWQNLEPERFPGRHDIDTSPEANAILAGYKNLDLLLGRFMSDYPGRLLILCTALSQEAWTDTQKQTYRPVDFDELLAFAGIDPDSVQVQPIMAEEFRITPTGPETLEIVCTKLNELVLRGKPLLRVSRGSNDLLVGCAAMSAVASDENCSNSRGHKVPFAALFYPIHGVRSGRHNPYGVLWIRNNRPNVVEEPVDLCRIAPSLLRYHGVPVPSSMLGECLPIE